MCAGGAIIDEPDDVEDEESMMTRSKASKVRSPYTHPSPFDRCPVHPAAADPLCILDAGLVVATVADESANVNAIVTTVVGVIG